MGTPSDRHGDIVSCPNFISPDVDVTALSVKEVGTCLTTTIIKYYDGPRTPCIVIIDHNLHDVIFGKCDPTKETVEVRKCGGTNPGTHPLSTDRYPL